MQESDRVSLAEIELEVDKPIESCSGGEVAAKNSLKEPIKFECQQMLHLAKVANGSPYASKIALIGSRKWLSRHLHQLINGGHLVNDL